MLTVTDLFCGAGGSGLGATAVPGVELYLAANHSPRAIETHQLNFPDCRHDCADISQVEPRRYHRSNILWASPECTNHSIAKGRRRTGGQGDLFADPLPDHVAERSRATMWDVPRFAEVHRYDAVIVENVVDAATWPPFRAWLAAMDSYGYEHHIVSLNSMHAPAIAAPRAPQSRDRMYVVFWRKGNRKPDLDIRPAAWCHTCGTEVRAMQAFKNGKKVGRYRAQYVYRCPHTACRNSIVEPHTAPAASAIDWTLLGQRIGDRPKPLSEKTLARIRAGLERYGRGLVVPVEGREGKQATPVSAPLRTQTARHESALLVPAGGTWNEAATPASTPFRARTTRENEGIAFITELRGGNSDARHVREPLATVCASGNHHMLVRHNTARSNPGQMCTPVTEPARTLTTAGHQSLVGWPPTAPTIEDCSFRMLTVDEIQAAMAFTPDYRITGSKREQVKQLGNGVTPPAAEWLIRAIATALEGHDTLQEAA